MPKGSTLKEISEFDLGEKIDPAIVLKTLAVETVRSSEEIRKLKEKIEMVIADIQILANAISETTRNVHKMADALALEGALESKPLH